MQNKFCEKDICVFFIFVVTSRNFCGATGTPCFGLWVYRQGGCTIANALVSLACKDPWSNAECISYSRIFVCSRYYWDSNPLRVIQSPTRYPPTHDASGSVLSFYLKSAPSVRHAACYSQPRLIPPFISHFRIVRHYPLDTPHWRPMLNDHLI